MNELDKFTGKRVQITHQLAEQWIIAEFRQVVAAAIRLDFLPLCMDDSVFSCPLFVA
jgi:hypothetical protein